MSPALSSTTIRFLVLLSVIKVTEVTAKTKTTTPLKCENGGISNGNRCTCPTFTEGTMCQNIKDRIIIGTTYKAKLDAVLTVNYTYSENLQNETSPEFLEFQKQYKELMHTLLEGYVASYESSLSSSANGEGVRVSSTITVELLYNQTIEVKDQYEEMYRNVQAYITSNQCKAHALCITSSSLQVFHTPSKYERCSENISAEYLQFYKPHVTTDGLACVTRCAPGTPGFMDCNSGNCQVKGDEGPQCFCPRTDLYLYTYAECQGAISIVAMYGGVGASIGVLVIVGVILGAFLYKKKYYS